MQDEEYARVLDCVVVACVDAVLLDPQGRMLIGKRSREPQPDNWIIGGRMRPGESFELAASNNIRRELKLDLLPCRFKYLGTYNLVWATRAQTPVENGCHTVSITMTAVLTPEEVQAMKPNDEYVSTKWVLPHEVANGEYHDALKQMARDLIFL